MAEYRHLQPEQPPRETRPTQPEPSRWQFGGVDENIRQARRGSLIQQASRDVNQPTVPQDTYYDPAGNPGGIVGPYRFGRAEPHPIYLPPRPYPQANPSALLLDERRRHSAPSIPSSEINNDTYTSRSPGSTSFRPRLPSIASILSKASDNCDFENLEFTIPPAAPVTLTPPQLRSPDQSRRSSFRLPPPYLAYQPQASTSTYTPDRHTPPPTAQTSLYYNPPGANFPPDSRPGSQQAASRDNQVKGPDTVTLGRSSGAPPIITTAQPTFSTKPGPIQPGNGEAITGVASSQATNKPMGELSPEGMDHRKRKRNRTIHSCLPCHTHKRKCNRERPCQRCKHMGITGFCVYETEETTTRDPRLSSDPYVEIDRLRHRVAELEQVIRILKNRPDSRLQLRLAPSQPQPPPGPLLNTRESAKTDASNSDIFGANGMKDERGTDYVSSEVARGGVPARDGSTVVKLQDSETMRSRPAEDRKGTKLIHESGPDSGAQMDVP